MEYQKNPDEIGAIWVREGQNGKYMTGKVTVNGQEIPIVCFLNSYKKNDNQPDYRILISKPKTDYPKRENNSISAQNTNRTLNIQEVTALREESKIVRPKEEILIDEIPFN